MTHKVYLKLLKKKKGSCGVSDKLCTESTSQIERWGYKMQKETLNFTGSFSHYTPINFEPYYVFTAGKKYLIKCIDYPKFIGKLSPDDLVNIEGDIVEKCTQGIKLSNIKWGVTNAQ
jgi:hypothetical protein